jgi:hypothetical protein
MLDVFFEIIQVSVGNRSQLSAAPSAEEWMWLRKMADKQSLTAIVLHGIEKLPTEQRPPKKLLLDWIGHSMIIRERNRQVTEVSGKLVQKFNQDGFNVCVLKGQANHSYYGEELGQLRGCGDVDIWVVTKEGRCKREDVRQVIAYSYKSFQVESLCWLHVELKPIDSVPVEVHLRPSFFNSPIRNRKFLNLFNFCDCTVSKEINGITLPVLKIEYDIIFQMNHLFRHLLDEGVGLRQVMDYYYLLRKVHDEGLMVHGHIKNINKTLKNLGMEKFARALMWVLQEVFAMPGGWMICGPSEKEGRFLLDEIIQAGNFGRFDARMKTLVVKKGHLFYQIQRASRRIRRNMRFLSSYPEEVIWEPVARFYHWMWKLGNRSVM